MPHWCPPRSDFTHAGKASGAVGAGGARRRGLRKAEPVARRVTHRKGAVLPAAEWPPSNGNPMAIQWQTTGKPMANPVANLFLHLIPAGGMSTSETSISITKSQLSKPPRRGIKSKRRFATGFATGLPLVCHWIATALPLDCRVRVSIRHGVRPARASLYSLSCVFAAFSWGWFGGGWRGPFGSLSRAGLDPAWDLFWEPI